MNKYFFCAETILIFLINISCNDTKTNQIAIQTNKTTDVKKKDTDKLPSTNKKIKYITTFIPKNYVLFEEIYGDLNKDGLEDCVIIIKGTDKKKVVKDEYRGELDRNRRGIIVLLNKNGSYELAVKNYDCFSSENEEGGNYYAPELSIEIEKSNLSISYLHGRYGYWSYKFRFDKVDFDLIGYDSVSYTFEITNRITSINFLTRKMIVEENINENAEKQGDEVFKKTTINVKRKELIKLSEIIDFDDIKISEEY